ncbi:hypothetical protein, partial [Mycobacterium tuberculosis]
IGNDLLSGGKVEFMSRLGKTIKIGRNFAAKDDIIMQGSNGSNHMLIGNHMISGGNIRFDSQGNQWNANIEVGGTLASAGNMNAVDSINGKLIVKENIIVGKNFGLPETDRSMDGSLLLDKGNLIVFGDANFGRNVNGKYNRLMVQGIAIKGYVKFDNNDYNNNNSVNSASICIT